MEKTVDGTKLSFPFESRLLLRCKSAIQIYTNIFGQHTYTNGYVCYIWGSKRKNRVTRVDGKEVVITQVKTSLSMRCRLAYTRTDICQHRLWSQERLLIHRDTVEGKQDIRGHTPADALRVPPLRLSNMKPGKRQAASNTRLAR